MRPLLALAPVTLAVALGGCGADDGEGDGAGTGTGLTWAEPPQLIRAATGGDDLVLVGKAENESAKQLKLVAERAEVRDSRGRVLEGDVRFTAAYGHGLYGADVPSEKLPPTERSRLGLTVFVGPGGTVPLFATFRDRHAEPPLSLDYGTGSLPVPSTVTGR